MAKSKTIFQIVDSLFKMIYIEIIDITKKWKDVRNRGLSQIIDQLLIYFDE